MRGGLRCPPRSPAERHNPRVFLLAPLGPRPARLQARIGSVQQCLVDLLEDGIAVARSKADAPEIDGLVHIQNGAKCGLQPGDLVDVEITDSDEHDLFGEALPMGTAQPRQALNLQVL